MGLFDGNHTCPAAKDDVDKPNSEEPIVGHLHFQDLLFYIGAGFTAMAALLSLYLAVSHLAYYVRPREQRQIVRILFYPVVYAVCSAFSVLDYPASLYLLPATSLYEPVAILAIFFLFIEFSHDDPYNREQYFAELEHKRKTGSQFKKGGWVTVPGGSLRWYRSKWVAVYFYFIVSIIMAIVELITQAAKIYCEWSFSPKFAHFWVVIIQNVVLPVGVLAVVQFYIRMNMEPHVKSHHPTLKILAFKGILLLNFLQAIVFQILIGAKVFKDHPKVTIQDQAIGIQQVLVCFDFMLVAFAFLFAYRPSEYRDLKAMGKGNSMNIFRAAADALNPTDIFVGMAYAFRLLLSGVGPRGNGSWGRTKSGYEKMQGNSGRTGGDMPLYDNSNTAYPGGASAMRMGRVSYQRPLSADFGPNPPSYADTRPLRSPSPNPYASHSPYRGRSPSPDYQPDYPPPSGYPPRA